MYIKVILEMSCGVLLASKFSPLSAPLGVCSGEMISILLVVILDYVLSLNLQGGGKWMGTL